MITEKEEKNYRVYDAENKQIEVDYIDMEATDD